MQPPRISIDRQNDRLAQGKTLLVVLACYFLLNVALRVILPHGLELDEAEQTHFSQWLLAGYSSQPPLYNWLQYAAVHVFGTSLVTLSLLKNVLLFSSYLFYWLAARQVLSDKRLAVIAALGLLTLPQIAFEAQRDLSHTVAAIFGTSLFLFALLRAISAPTLLAFVLLGIASGVGALTKYNFALVPIVALLAILADSDLRRRLLDWRLLVSAVIALVIVSPHAVWLIDNFQATSSHTMRKLVGSDNLLVGMLHGFGTLALSALGFGALALAVFAAAYREQLRGIINAQSPWTRFIGRMLLISLAVIVLMIVFAGVEKVRDRWLTPLLLPLPLYLALKIDAAQVALPPGIKRIWMVAGIIMLLIPSILFGRIAAARLTGDYEYINIPFPAVTHEIAGVITGKNALVIAGDGQLAGNIRFNLPAVTVITPTPPTGMPAIQPSAFSRVVFVWREGKGTTPAPFEEAFGSYLQSQGIPASSAKSAIVSYGYAWGNPGDQYQFGLAFLDMPPR